METTGLSGMFIPIGTILLVVLLQISFWLPVEPKKPSKTRNETKTTTTIEEKKAAAFSSKGPTASVSKRMKITALIDMGLAEKDNNVRCTILPNGPAVANASTASIDTNTNNQKSTEDDHTSTTTTTTTTTTNDDTSFETDAPRPTKTIQQEGRIWKCACEIGFLPAGILRTFGNAEAMMRLGVGQCYHKK